MQYLTIFISQQPNIKTTAGGEAQAVFPNTKLGLNGLIEYATNITTLGELVKSGDAGLYVTQAGSPIELPFEMNLNYVDLENAKRYDPNQLEKAIQIMSQYNDDDIINSGDVVEDGEWTAPEYGVINTMNHSRDQLIHILSSVAKTIGTVVSSQKQYREEWGMANQVLITRPLLWNRMAQDEAIQLIGNGEDEQGDYGLGGDWWKNPQEAIKRISKIITEDPDIFD